MLESLKINRKRENMITITNSYKIEFRGDVLSQLLLDGAQEITVSLPLNATILSAWSSKRDSSLYLSVIFSAENLPPVMSPRKILIVKDARSISYPVESLSHINDIKQDRMIFNPIHVFEIIGKKKNS
jgi:hypothetical protein